MLFDLEADPGERIDLAAHEPDKVAALSVALDRSGDRVETESATDLDVDAPRAPGYID